MNRRRDVYGEKKGDQVRSDLDGKDYTILEFLNGLVTLKSSDGNQLLTGIISFRLHYKKNEETAKQIRSMTFP